MKELVNSLKGDKVIWAFVALLALFSFMSVFSASSNLAYKNNGSGNTFTYLLKHAAQFLVGFFILYKIHKVPYHYFKTISKILLPVVWGLLIYTLLKGTIIEGANASRWIQIPFIGITFQTSALASIVLYVYVAHYLSKKRETPITFQNSLWELWTPVFITLIFILPANFSTAALIFSMVIMLVFIGKYPLKYIGVILGAGAIGLLFFVIVAITFPDAFPNRVDTWIARIDNFATDKPDEDDYQIEKAKIAIASGGLYGLGPGKSVQKNFLPQSSSDFIYAIIIEEYGYAGGLFLLLLYMTLLYRAFSIVLRTENSLAALLAIGLSFSLVVQALINMGVAVNILPVTGLALPIVSRGGTSILFVSIAFGIILSASRTVYTDKEDAE